MERALLAMPTVRSENQLDLVSTYYDTPALAVYRERLTLRVRKRGREFVQTVKAENPTEVDVLERREWEEPIPSKRPDLDARKTGKRLPDGVHRQDLRPVFVTKVTRKVIEIEPSASTRIEAAIDTGEIRTAAGGAVAPISELELELQRGDPAVLYDVALRLIQVAHVRIETQSKAERGYRLLGVAGAVPQAVHAGPVVLDPAITVEAALQRFGRHCLVHMLRNEPVALAGEPEGIHQMRVAVRRLRSALSALKPMLPAEHHGWASEELKRVAHALGPARNWDILAASLLPPVSDALPDCRELEHLVRVAERCRRAAFDDANLAILSERHTEAMLRLLRWFTARGWRDQPMSERAALLFAPIVDVAPALIERCHRKARRRCKRFAELAPTERHKLRIALKKLRYLSEFVGSLFDQRRVRTLVNRLKSLQDDLGHANDLRVAYDLLDQCCETTDLYAREIARAGGIVLGWHERDLADREPKLRKAVRRFKQLEPSW